MTTKRTIPLESTGDAALDAILGGGIPARSVTLIAGEPGSGKSVLTLQLLFHAARQGKRCLYFTTLSEPAVKVMGYMQMFSFFDERLLDDRISFVDLGAAVREGPERVTQELTDRVEKAEPDFVAIDSFRAIGELKASGTNRPFIYDLAVQLSAWGATAFLVGEYTRAEYSQFAEFAVADGILRLGTQEQALTSVREFEVLKLRGANYVTGRHFCEISQRGMSFYPRVRAPDWTDEPPFSLDDRVSTGVEGLDGLLAGGLPRNTITVALGATGTGKTMLGLQFLIEAARRGERGVLFTLEETPEQLRAIASGLGWDMARLERDGMLTVQYTSPVELSTDRFLFCARHAVEERGARRAVFDSLTSLALGVASERRFKELVYAVAKHLRRAGVTPLFTVEAPQLLGAATLSGSGVSFLADNLIQMRYFEVDGRLERAISVIKARGVNLSTELRSYHIGPGGLSVSASRFRDLRGVLTGVPSQERHT